jgi:hypothetical protein
MKSSNYPMGLAVASFVSALFLLVTGAAWANPSSKSPQEEMQEAFEREYSFLTLQKESLLRQRDQWKKRQESRLERARLEVGELQRSVVSETHANDARFEEVDALEKRKRAMTAEGSSLEALYKRIGKVVADFEPGLALDSSAKALPATAPAELKLADFAGPLERAGSLITEASAHRRIHASYRDEQGELTEGPVLRLGRVAAYAEADGKRALLVPEGSGLLKAVSPGALTDGLRFSPVAWFENLSVSVQLKRRPSWADQFSGAMPVVLLGLVFLIVLWLFGAIARV